MVKVIKVKVIEVKVIIIIIIIEVKFVPEVIDWISIICFKAHHLA